MQIFATALLAATVAAGMVDVAIKEGETTAFDASFNTSVKVTGEGAAQKLIGMISSSVTMADGYENEDGTGVAYTYLCQGEGADAKTCYEMKFENDEDEGQSIKVTTYEVSVANHKISAANAAKLTSAENYFQAKGQRVGEKEAKKGTDGWKLRNNKKLQGAMQETIVLDSCEVDKSSGNVELNLVLA